MKKMRRMIPALCMLLVSAIMLTTASYAWFTINDQVTASGMQVQAKSTGSLVVGKQLLQYTNDETTADFSDENENITIKPITWKDGTWKVITSEVDSFTGMPIGDATYEAITVNDSGYFIDRVIYIGSAGDTLYNQNLTINLSATTSDENAAVATKAYSVALYVIAPGEAYYNTDLPVFNTDGTVVMPDGFAHVDTYSNGNMVTLKGDEIVGEDDAGTGYYSGYTIPSIVGVETGGVGLKVVIRIFVDGNLDAVDPTTGNKVTKPKDTYVYTPVGTGATFSSSVTYYKDANGSQLANTNNYSVGDDISGTGWYTRALGTPQQVEYKYINSDQVPMTASTIQIIFSGAEEAQAPVEEPEDDTGDGT